MGITIINETQEPFVIVNKNILTDRSLNMRDRGMLATLLSLPPTWEFSAKGMAAILPDGIDGVNAAIKSLERKGYITRRRMKDGMGRFTNTELTIHTTPQKDNPVMENTIVETPEMEKPAMDNPVQLNIQKVINQEVNTKESITHSEGSFSVDTFHKIIAMVKKQIDYEAVIIDRPYDKRMIDAIGNLIAEIFLSNQDTVRIMKEDYPIQLVKDRFRKLNIFNAEYVIDSFKREQQPITDVKAYLLTCLYNAPVYENVYWQNQVSSTLK